MYPNFKSSGHEVYVFDNLKRRGSEINLSYFKEHDINFIHGDIRCSSDFSQISEDIELIVDASAEPSVHAGIDTSPLYLIDTNFNGTINCLEFARKTKAFLIFLSTSRVYSIPPLLELRLEEGETRFSLDKTFQFEGLSQRGIKESFPVHLFRSLYGATKLSSEYFIQEYSQVYGLKTVINRCGVIAGAGQFGKVDQGVFTLWVLNHFFKKPLSYTGFGGKGKQVRDLLHPQDLFNLMTLQIEDRNNWSSEVYNVGGGLEISVSLLEFTRLCQKVTGNTPPINSIPKTATVDIPYYITDYSKVFNKYGWSPKITPLKIVENIYQWINLNQNELVKIL